MKNPDATGAPEPGANGGLTSAEAAERLLADGPNEIEEHAGRTPFAIFVGQIASPLVLLLIVACVISICGFTRTVSG